VPKHKTTRPEVPDCLGSGGAKLGVIAPPPGELFSETNDNSVAILPTYGTACVLLAGDAEGRVTRQVVHARGLKRLSRFETTKQSQLRFRARLTEGASEVELALM
jgi:hypothetical protein